MQSVKVSKSYVASRVLPARPVAKVARCMPLVARAEADDAAVPIEKSGPNFSSAKDIDAIMKALPHRYEAGSACCSASSPSFLHSRKELGIAPVSAPACI